MAMLENSRNTYDGSDHESSRQKTKFSGSRVARHAVAPGGDANHMKLWINNPAHILEDHRMSSFVACLRSR